MMSNILYGKRCHAIVERGPMEKIPTSCFEHELPLIEVHHGEGSVTLLKKKDLPEDGMDYDAIGQVVELDGDAEWDRLIGKYGRHPANNITVCEWVFQNSKVNLLKAGTRKPKVTSTSPVVDKTKVISVDESDGLGEDELKALLAGLGVEVDPNAGLPYLEEVLSITLMEKLDGADIEYDAEDQLDDLLNKYNAIEAVA